MGGAPACANTISDGSNCGVCGHSCLGGTCASGICQPFLLGTVPSTVDFARQTIVSSGEVYVFSQVGQGSPSNVWLLDASKASTPTEVTITGSLSCVMNGELFWSSYNNAGGGIIVSCALSNCAATTTPVVTLESGESAAIGPGCDRVNDELVWGTYDSSSSTSSFYTVYRSSPIGANLRTMTSFSLPSDGASWQVADIGLRGETDRIFYARNDSTSSTGTLYYISTDIVNAAGVSIAAVSGQIFTGSPVLANDTTVLANESTSSSTDEVFSAPLPNGVLSGAPPMFTTGTIFGGVIDQMRFYGTISNSSIPNDAVVTCLLSSCLTPTIIARGQANANYFTDDATAIYWTTSAQTSSQGFSVWKAAK